MEGHGLIDAVSIDTGTGSDDYSGEGHVTDAVGCFQKARRRSLRSVTAV
jgi:hypothetical protein